MPVNKFRYLQHGDTVDIVAPAGKSEPAVLQKITELLASWGLKVNIPSNTLGDDLICANTDEIRFALLKDALLNPDSKAIWCLRGGYGSMRLIPELEQLTPPKQQKLFIGFSDITALHIFLNQKWGWPTIHGPSAQQAATDQLDHDSIIKVQNLFLGKTKEIEFNNLVALNNAAKIMRKITAPIVGTNLTLVECSLGTSWHINTEQKILLLEDVNMTAYQIDRSLQHLKQAHVFKNAVAVLLGDFMGLDKEKDAELIDKVLQRFANELSIPVLKIPTIGHDKTNYVLPLGVIAELQLNKLEMKL
ncbi:MAG: LD-carboxypeptidase [Gammaproteobacteria bacterium]|nr:LD-carboxypeptidase [Gammaproteobacteria bacterium]